MILIAIFVGCVFAELLHMAAQDREDERRRRENGWISDDERRRRLRTGELVPGVNYFGNPDC